MNKIVLQSEYQQMLTNILALYLGGLKVRVYMFGSRAKGSPKPTSDIDLALDGTFVMPDKLMQTLTEAFSDSNIPYKVDIIDLNSIEQTFKSAIINDLVEIKF